MALSPLFEIYDPLGTLQERAELGLLPLEGDEDPLSLDPFGSRKPRISDLMPKEEQRGLLNTLAAAGTSGLAGLGWILDTPGAMVRGALSGGLGKGLSALWETSDERVDGRELLRQYGAAGSEDNWGNFSGGLAAEIFLDPLTYASFGLNQVLGQGAKTAAGKAAQRAGLLADVDVVAKNSGMGTRQFLRQKDAAEQLLQSIKDKALQDAKRAQFVGLAGEEGLSKPLTAMNRVSVPFLYDNATDLFGQGVGDAVAKFGDDLGRGVMTNPYTGPVARQLTRAFDPSVMGQVDYDRQWEARELLSGQRRRAQADRLELAKQQFDAEKSLNEISKSLNDRDVSAALRTYLERGIENVPEELQPLFNQEGFRRLAGFFEGYRDVAPIRAKEIGIPLEVLRPRAGGEFVPRQQAAFDVLENPVWPAGVTPPESIRKPYGRANKPIQIGDTAGKRRDYTDVIGATDTLNELSLDADLQEALRRATPEQTQDILREWTRDTLTGGEGDDLYAWLDDVDDDGEFIFRVPDLPKDHPLVRQQADLQAKIERATNGGELHLLPELQKQLDSISAQIPNPRDYYRDTQYRQLGDFLRKLDPQHARKGVPVFGRNTFNEIAGYVTGRGKAESMGEGMLDILARNKTDLAAEAVEGGVNYTAREALKKLGYTDDAAEALARKLNGQSLDQVSFNKKFIDDWTAPMLKGRSPEELNPLLELADDFTRSFKTLALAFPSRLTRDAYSGAFASAMTSSFNPLDWYAGTQIRKGNYDKRGLFGLLPSVYDRIKNAPGYEGLTQDEAIRKFVTEAGGQGLGTSTFADDIEGAASSSLREAYPGAAGPSRDSLLERAKRAQLIRGWNPLNSDWSPFAVRSGSGNRNPILEAFDRGAEYTDAGNRYGTYLNRIRKGDAPEEAMRVANLTQVDYRPEAFTDFERRYLKRIMPFYSYTRGIMPLIADELVNRPAGLMGKSIRAISRGSQPSDDNFVPEYLRQSASVPVPEGLPLFGLGPNSQLKRFLTNIDLPFESAINLITPGVGNTLFQQAGNTLTKTALNLLGQTNPLIKGPLEAVTNRQFYSGRQLSDLYSMLEQGLGPPGRSLEQLIVNAPGGSRLLGTIRQISDDRLDPSEKWSKVLVNALTGLKFQDVDQERTKRLAARDMLNELLETTPGVRTYENITVPEDVLATMPGQQRQMYLLYKIIQSEAAKRARDRKRAEEMALDPLQVLGVVQR